jgi:predicted outer membrane lipoprotein
MKKDVLEKVSALIIAAFGLVAALAWNEAIKALFVGPCESEGAGALCALSGGGPWVYAIIVTIFAVIAAIWIGKMEEKANGPKVVE